MNIFDMFDGKFGCKVCGQTPCNCTGITEGYYKNQQIDREFNDTLPVQASMLFYNKLDKKEFRTIKFSTQADAEAWADRNNATIENIVPIEPVDETGEAQAIKPEQADKVAGGLDKAEIANNHLDNKLTGVNYAAIDAMKKAQAAKTIKELASPNIANKDYQKMMAFVKDNRIEGLPPEQQIAVALFKELQKQKQHNAQLDAELDAAQQRIDAGASRDELQGKELGKHQSALDREQQANAKQQAALGQMDQAHTEREEASEKQIQSLVDRLETIKTKPGLDPSAVADLEKKISHLEQIKGEGGKGISADAAEELADRIDAIAKSPKVSADDIKGLSDKIAAAEKDADQARTALGAANTELDRKETAYQNTLKIQGNRIKNAEERANKAIELFHKAEEAIDEVDRDLLNVDDRVRELTAKATGIETAVSDVVRPVLTKHEIALARLTGQPATMAEAKLYYKPIATTEQQLVNEFKMQRDSKGWYLTESAGAKLIKQAHTAFGAPKVIK